MNATVPVENLTAYRELLFAFTTRTHDLSDRGGWSTATVGLSLASYGVFFALVQAGLIRLILCHFGEIRAAILGLSAGILGFTILAQHISGLWAFLFSPLWAMRAVTGTVLIRLLSRHVADDGQGVLRGMLSAMTGLATLLGILLMTQVFALATRESTPGFDGAPFGVSAALASAARLRLTAPRILLNTFKKVERGVQ